jgi:hypothetical protein
MLNHTGERRIKVMKMKRVLAAALLAVLLIPSVSYAGDWRRGRGYGHSPHHRTVVINRHSHYNGAAIAAGVLGGIATGIILDRVLIPPPAPPVAYYPPTAYPPPPPRDPYDAGYSDGYSRGVDRGRYDRYRDGRSRGFSDGYEDARAGRAY